MKDSNELHLNQATMVEALQYYLESQFDTDKAPVVQSVTYNTNHHGGGQFVIQLTEDKSDEGPSSERA